MKTLYIIRHAKSGWGDFSLPDFDRPLNDRGKKDAPEMAGRLKGNNIIIDAFVSSPAKRARKTCKLFCEVYDYPEDNIRYVDALYLAPAETIFEVTAALDNRYSHVAIFAHNPGVTDFANRLTGQVHIDEMPTCGIFAVEAAIDNWQDFRHAEKRFLFFDYPKKEPHP